MTAEVDERCLRPMQKHRPTDSRGKIRVLRTEPGYLIGNTHRINRRGKGKRGEVIILKETQENFL